jgi:hypothetical protein
VSAKRRQRVNKASAERCLSASKALGKRRPNIGRLGKASAKRRKASATRWQSVGQALAMRRESVGKASTKRMQSVSKASAKRGQSIGKALAKRRQSVGKASAKR